MGHRVLYFLWIVVVRLPPRGCCFQKQIPSNNMLNKCVSGYRHLHIYQTAVTWTFLCSLALSTRLECEISPTNCIIIIYI